MEFLNSHKLLLTVISNIGGNIMNNLLNVGGKLFRERSASVTIIELYGKSIKVRTSSASNGFYISIEDIGKKYFIKVEHIGRKFKSKNEYLAFCQKENVKNKSRDTITRLEKITDNKEKNQEYFEKLESKKQQLSTKQNTLTSRIQNQEFIEFDSLKKEKQFSDEVIVAKKSINPSLRYGSLGTNISSEAKEREIILQILKQREINNLIHFTRIENLHSILLHGLVPVSLHELKNIKSICNDYERYDGRLHSSSLSIEFPNYKLFFKFRRNSSPQQIWVILKFSTKLLFSPTNAAYFCYTNAARVSLSHGDSREMFSAKSFNGMFYDPITIKEGKVIYRIDMQLKDNWTTDPQAEILVRNTISPEYISGLIFEKQSDLDEYTRIYGSNQLSKYNPEVNANLFKARQDYSFWKQEM